MGLDNLASSIMVHASSYASREVNRLISNVSESPENFVRAMVDHTLEHIRNLTLSPNTFSQNIGAGRDADTAHSAHHGGRGSDSQAHR